MKKPRDFDERNQTSEEIFHVHECIRRINTAKSQFFSS